MTVLNPEQRDELIDQYCDWYVKDMSRKTLEMIVWDEIHEELHTMPTELMLETVERDCPGLLE